ncbi:MAG: toll/interleukin-1 receptor domain-containing protein [Planctomycetaceae bacterium]
MKRQRRDELVLKIIPQLRRLCEERGITHGDDWRRVITDCILKGNRLLSFLSKHSTRDPAVCRDEIAIAIGAKGGNIQTILVESEQEVQPPVNIGHIQWLDMPDWKEQRAAGDAAWEQCRTKNSVTSPARLARCFRSRQTLATKSSSPTTNHSPTG